MSISADWRSVWEETVWDTVIVGAGLAGLTAAVLLAGQGKRIIVLEKSAHPGGRAQTTVMNGCSLNLGPHALYRKAEANRIWNSLGIHPEGKQLSLQSAHLVENGRLLDLPTTPWKLLTASGLSFREKAEFGSFFSGLARMNTAAWDRATLDEFLRTRVKNPRVRDMIAMMARLSTYSADPDRISAGTVLRRLAIPGGVLYLDGGWQSLVRQLRERAGLLGAVFAAGAAVRTVSATPAGLAVALGDGRQLRARTVLAAVGPREAAALIGGSASARLHEAAAQPPVQAACLDIALASLPQPDRGFALGLDRPLYFSNHSRAASLTSEPDYAVLHVAKYLSAADASAPDPERDVAELEQLLDLLQPGWRKRVAARRFLPHVTVMHALPTADSGGECGRPAADDTGMPGYYAAGDWVGPEGLLVDAAAASAKTAAEAIAARLGGSTRAQAG